MTATDLARLSSAPASASSSVAPQPRAEGAHGAAGYAPGPPSGLAGGFTPNSNRPGTRNPRAAEGATAIARIEGTS